MKSVFTDEYRMLLDWLVEKRNQSGLTQQALSKLLHKPQSYVSKYENAERRLDVIEFLKISVLIDADPFEIMPTLIRKLAKNK